jgi:hypothetical protein
LVFMERRFQESWMVVRQEMIWREGERGKRTRKREWKSEESEGVRERKGKGRREEEENGFGVVRKGKAP